MRRPNFAPLLALLSALALATAAAPRLHAGPNSKSPFGVGLELGGGFLQGTQANLSLSGKYWMNAINAVDMDLGGGNGGLGLGADYLWHNYKAFNSWSLPLYYGVGGYANVGSHLGAGARGKMGVDWLFPHTPWETYVELVPSLNVVGGLGFGVGLELGGRFYF